MKNPLTPEFISFVRESLESIYTGKLTVYRLIHKHNPKTGLMEQTTETFFDKIPCRMVKQVSSVPENDPKEFHEVVNIMTQPEVKIPTDSLLEVEFNGKHETFKLSTEPLVYSTHQTIRCVYYTEEGSYASNRTERI